MASLGAKFASGTGWLAIGAAGDYAMQFVIFTVLARLVSITELGIVAFALVLTDLGRIFVNGGRAELMVRHPEWDDRLASVAFTRTLVSAVTMALLLATVGAWAIERFYAPGGGLPTAALSLIFVIEAVRTVHAAKMRREFRFRALAGRAIVGTLLSGAAAVFLAYRGWGIWALVVQRLIAQLSTTTLTLMASRWRPHWLWSDPVTRGTEEFTRKVTLSRALDVAILRMPDLLIGVLIGPAAVALYRVGARALEAILRIVVQPFQDASLAVYARIGEPVAVGQTLMRISRVALLLLVPVFGGAALIGTDLTVLLFGAKYQASGPIMSALAIGSVPQALLLLFGSAYLGSGRPHALFVSNILSLTITGAAIVIGSLTGGAYGAAVATAVAQYVVFLAGLHLVRGALSARLAPLLAGLAFPALGVAAMALACRAAEAAWLGGWPLPVRLAGTVVLGAGVYGLMVLALYRPYLRPLLKDIAPIVPQRLRRFLPG